MFVHWCGECRCATYDCIALICVIFYTCSMIYLIYHVALPCCSIMLLYYAALLCCSIMLLHYVALSCCSIIAPYINSLPQGGNRLISDLPIKFSIGFTRVDFLGAIFKPLKPGPCLLQLPEQHGLGPPPPPPFLLGYIPPAGEGGKGVNPPKPTIIIVKFIKVEEA